MKISIKKSLIYQWFYTTKWAVFLALIVWALYSKFVIVEEKISSLKYNVGSLTSDKINHISLTDLVFFLMILVFVYILSNGLNKRSKIMLINNYSKKLFGLKGEIIGEKIEEMFREMIAGSGAVKTTIHKYVC